MSASRQARQRSFRKDEVGHFNAYEGMVDKAQLAVVQAVGAL
jgi:hypothetical protein